MLPGGGFILKLVRFIADQKIHFGILEKDQVKVVQEPGTDWCGFPLTETGATYDWKQ
jgi:hypothetical protein